MHQKTEPSSFEVVDDDIYLERLINMCDYTIPEICRQTKIGRRSHSKNSIEFKYSIEIYQYTLKRVSEVCVLPILTVLVKHAL